MNKAFIVHIDKSNQELIKEIYLIHFLVIYQNYLVALICKLTNAVQYLESDLHALIVAMSGKPWASFQVVKKNLSC